MTPIVVTQLDNILNPKSLAIIGASGDPLKLSNWITVNALKSGFQGRIYLVNPRTKTIDGVATYPRLHDIPGSVDVAAIMVPAAAVAEVLKECIEKHVKGAIVFSAGFKEVGEAGQKREQEILTLAREGGLRIIGPNCMGVYSAASNLNLTALSVKKGGVALLSQSGGYGLEIAATAMLEGIAFSKFVSTGDKADLQDHEYLEYLAQDPATKVIVLYLESVEQGRAFFETARRITRDKPIFAIKIGRSAAGQAAAQSHTGALAGEDVVYDAAFRQAGIIRAGDIEELFDYLRAYLTQPLPKGNRVGILVGSGGIGVAAADKCAELGLEVPPLSPQNQDLLRGVLPAFASFRNPVDFTGSGAENFFGNWSAVRDIFTDPNIDSWFFSFPGSGFSGIEGIVKSYEPLMAALEGLPPAEVFGRADAPMVAAGNERDTTIKPLLERLFGLLFYPTPERAIRALAMLHRYRQFREARRAAMTPLRIKTDASACEKIIANALRSKRTVLTEVESKQLLSAYQIPTVEAQLAHTRQEALGAAAKSGYPVALKVVSPQILHKSDAGGVRLNLETPDQVAAAYQEILRNAKAYKPDAFVLGVSVQRMAPAGIEVIVGTKRDPQFGPLILFGIGGILVELFKDTSLRLIPVDGAEAEQMMQEIKLHQVLAGYRQCKPVDKNALASILLRVSALAEHHPAIKEMDLNPVFAYPSGAVVVDARILLEPTASGRSE